MSLIDELQKNDKSGLFTSNDNFVSYSTGYLPIDYANGFFTQVYNKEKDEIKVKPITGIRGGSFLTIIGRSGTGKSTLAAQIGGNIIRPFESGLLIYVDAERTAIRKRVCDITGLSIDDKRFILKNEDATIELLFDLLEEIKNMKETGGKAYKYQVDDTEYSGEILDVYVPTVIIIDSLYTLSSRETKDDTLEGNMSAGKLAKDIAQFYTKALGTMSKYNITIIATNHIKTKIVVDRFATNAKQLMMLNNDETLPRGDAPVYLALNVFKLVSNKSDIYEKDDAGFDGVKTRLMVAKTKTNWIGSSIDITFNTKIGYDPIFSLYEFAKGCNIIEGKNPHLRFSGYEDFKFSRKEFRSKFINDEEFRKVVYTALKPMLEAMIGSKDDMAEGNDSVDGKYVDVGDFYS